ncbi:hypothetical protein TD95_000587 [Thielaviopsis punctulata]|uniref:C2 domain-containing protein n=1 Tax=Thielaviopsis punctulata TaxID=72032 RepID=A0A0F4ZMM4_9PEZI|nr:hypothetical protein TD95_000587 [Thielaviopsis punctulata]
MSAAPARQSMSITRKSVNLNRVSMLNSASAGASSSNGSERSPSTSSMSREMSQEDAFSYALRAAYLHHLLQPRQKRRQFVNSPQKPIHRSTTSVNALIFSELSSGGSSKLPHGFRTPLLERLQGVVVGSERMPGYNDPAVKRCFAEVYTTFTSKDFLPTLKDRKIEPLVLMVYSRATQAAAKHAAPGDESHRLLPDRHVALFVRLLIRLLRDEGHERDKSNLLLQLEALEKKLLTNSQDLSMTSNSTSVEVTVPISYEVKDMAYVQQVCEIFGYPQSKAQNEINANKNIWTEEAAMKDFKSYQQRLNLGMSGTLQSRDFDVDDAFEEWKNSEKRDLSSIMMDILTVRPDLARMSTGTMDKPLPLPNPLSPSSTDGDRVYSDLAQGLSPGGEFDGMGFDPAMAMNMLSFDDSPAIRSAEDASYVLIPNNPRLAYRTVLQYTMTSHLLTTNSNDSFVPVSRAQSEFLLFLATMWRIPQFTRHVTLLEIAARKYADGEIDLKAVGFIFQYVQNAPDMVKRPPHLANYDKSIVDIETSRWTMQDYAAYKQVLTLVYERGIRELCDIVVQCYDHAPPDPSMTLAVLRGCIYEDEAFERRPAEQSKIRAKLEQDLRDAAHRTYMEILQNHVPADETQWNFAHVQDLRLAVLAALKRIQAYMNNMIQDDEIEGVKPLDILIEKVFPTFEVDAEAIIRKVIEHGKTIGEEVAFTDGFSMYSELCNLRNMHKKLLPNVRFAFNVEELFLEFVQKWLAGAEERVLSFVDEAVKHDSFQVRVNEPDEIATDTQRHSVSVIDIFSLFNQTVDQIIKLKWQNELHKARFMTQLSRMFSTGIARYCEIVDGQFTREMDRPSARELAAANQSAQEKLFQYAKDALNSKAKAEPFQFYPEASLLYPSFFFFFSFVKLNNIEYAIQELDKLEKLMDVDACIATIERFEDAPKPTRKGSNTYIFTIKMIEAEDLKPCDTSGYSDPYIILCDEHRKRLAKSRIIYRSLNPRWDESVDITVHSTINVIATIWDYDTFGDHDFVGRAALKLDPQHFKDYLPREFWLDLDTQGRLLLRVSMEAERDDIQFHFGKAFRHLKRTERDMVRRITDKLTVEIQDTLSMDTLRAILKTGGIGAQVVSFWKKTQPVPTATEQDIDQALDPLYDYFDANFAIMKQTLTEQTMLAVMARLWKQVLMSLEGLMVPPLSDKPSEKRPLNEKELDIVHKWRDLMYNFFNAKDENGVALGVPEDMLKSPKYHEFTSLYFFYLETTENLIRESERMAAATAQRHKNILQNPNRLSAPPSLGPMAPGFGSMGTIRRGRSILMNRNLGAMRRAREEKRKEAQADPSDDGILRILRMRPEAAGYLKERSRQRERQESTAATVMMMQQGGGIFGR